MLTSWLAPPGASRSGSPSLHLWPVGRLWDALRTPDAVGMPVLDRLLADPDDAALLGPVLWDRSSRHLYWLLARGASDCYPHTTVLLPAKAWLAAPPVEGRSNRIVWLHLPEPPRLTGPAWLAAAFNLELDPHPGASAMTAPAQSEPRCQMCTEPPSPAGPVLPVGAGGESVDMGHEDCFRLAQGAARAAFRASRTAATAS